MQIETRQHGTTVDDQPVLAYRISNDHGVSVELSDFGASILSLFAPAANGERGNVVLGLRSLAEYESDVAFLGRTVGRYANRIAAARFTLGGIEHQLEANDGTNHLHGGPDGFHQRVWFASPFDETESAGIAFSHHSLDGSGGYPGELAVLVTYTLHQTNELVIDYRATTSKPTIVNLTNHSYFNLSGDHERPITDHLVQIDADRFVPVDREAIPIQDPLKVEHTPFDLRVPQRLGPLLASEHEQLVAVGGFDHTFVVNDAHLAGTDDRVVASVIHEGTGRRLDVRTTKPGLHLYTGNHLAPEARHRRGLCLETQFYPNSPNMPSFPIASLYPEQRYEHRTVFALSSV